MICGAEMISCVDAIGYGLPQQLMGYFPSL
jgi:hypothetical protein